MMKKKFNGVNIESIFTSSIEQLRKQITDGIQIETVFSLGISIAQTRQ